MATQVEVVIVRIARCEVDAVERLVCYLVSVGILLVVDWHIEFKHVH